MDKSLPWARCLAIENTCNVTALEVETLYDLAEQSSITPRQQKPAEMEESRKSESVAPVGNSWEEVYQ